MFDYAVRELGYSTGAAWRRLKTMRLCAEVQGARTRLQEGTLTLDAAAQSQARLRASAAQAVAGRRRHRRQPPRCGVTPTRPARRQII